MISWVEGWSLLVLLAVAVPTKYLVGDPRPVQIVGPIHGAGFLLYSLWLVEIGIAERWRAGDLGRLWAMAFVPFGFLVVGRFVRAREAQGRGGVE